MKKILSILICVILGVNLTYAATAKAVATAFAQPATAGDVYVSKTNVDINTITGWAGTSTNENTGTSGLSAGKASVYSYAKGKNGYTFIGWSDTQDGNINNTNNPRRTYAETGFALIGFKYIDATTDEAFYAQFKPIITVPTESQNVTLNKKGDTEAQEQVSISLYNAKDFDYSISRTAGSGTALITCTHPNVSGSGSEPLTLTITTVPGVVSGDKFTITLTATNGAVGYIYVEVQADVQVLFAKPEVGQGSYTATRADNSGFAVTLSHESAEDVPVVMTSASEYTYNVVANPASGYRFRRWIVQNAKGTSYYYGKNYQYKASNGERFTAEFIKDGYAQFIVLGSDTANYKYAHLDDAFDAAKNQWQKTVVAVYQPGELTIAQKSNAVDVITPSAGYKYQHILPRPASGIYTIPAGYTLLIPGLDKSALLSSPTKIGYTYLLGKTTVDHFSERCPKPQCVCKLTVESGTKIEVYGNISVYSCLSAVMGYTGRSTGYGQIHLEDDSHIEVMDGAVLHVLGYITGEPTKSSVLAKNGSNIYEAFQLTDWRGGTGMAGGNIANLLGDLKNTLINNSNEVFPAGQYYVQNIETMLQLEAGATEWLTTGVDVSMPLPVTTQFITKMTTGDDLGLFALGDGTVLKKYYDGLTDRMKYELLGNGGKAKMSYMFMEIIVDTKQLGEDVLGGLGGIGGAMLGDKNISLDSREYVLPINNNIDVLIDNITLDVPYKIAFMAGSSMTVTSDAQLNIKNEMYLYDKELNVRPDFIEPTKDADGKIINYGGYYGSGSYPLKPVTYTAYHGTTPGLRTSESVRYPEKLTDATFIIDGTLTMEGKGTLYTTTYSTDIMNVTDTSDEALERDFGANITSTGGGVLNFNSIGTNETTNQIDQTGTSPTYITNIPVCNAWLRNANGTRSGGTGDIRVGDTYMYINDEWIKPEADIRNPKKAEFIITLPDDVEQDVECELIEKGVSISNIVVTLNNERFELVGDFDGKNYKREGNSLIIPVKYKHNRIHNVGNPNTASIAIALTYVDPITEQTTTTNRTINLTGTENYKPAFNVAINGVSVVDDGTYDAIVGTGVNETTRLSVVITPNENNVTTLETITWIEAQNVTSEPFTFAYGANTETKLSDAKLYYTPTQAGNHEGTLTLRASYTDAASKTLDTTIVIDLKASVSLKQNTLAFASFPEKIYGNNLTDDFRLFEAGTNNAETKITIEYSPEGVIEIDKTAGFDAMVRPIAMGTATITVYQEPSASIREKSLETSITVLSNQELLKSLPLCVDNLEDFNIHTLYGNNVSFNVANNTIDFNSINTGSEWIFQFKGNPEQISFIPNGNNTWYIQERESDTAPWTNVAVWTTLISGEEVSFPLLPSTSQVRIQYGTNTSEIGTLSNLCISDLKISADVKKLYLPIYFRDNRPSEKKIVLTHTKTIQQISITDGLQLTYSISNDNKGTVENPYYHTEVTITAEPTTAEGLYTLTAKMDDDNETIVEIQAYHAPVELPIKLAEDVNDEIFYMATENSAYAQWNAKDRKVVFLNPGAALSRSVTFAFNGAPDIITFDASVNIVDSEWTVEESVDGTPGSFFESSLTNRDSLDGTIFVHKLNYTTRYVRLSYKSTETREISLSNLVIEGYPKVLVSPEKMMFGTSNPQQCLTITAINLNKIEFVLDDDGDAFSITTDFENFTNGTTQLVATEETHPDALGRNKVNTILLGVSWLQETALDESKITLYNGDDHTILAVIPIMGTDDYLIKENASNSGIYTGIPDGTRDINNDEINDKYTFHGNTYQDYSYHQVDLTNAYAEDGTALFDYLFIYGETTPASGTDITSPKKGSADGSTNIGSNAVTPYYIYKKAPNTDGLYKGYKFVGKVDNANVANKETVSDVVTKDDATGTVYIGVQNALRVYMTGFCPYATTGYTKNQEGVFLFRGNHGSKLDVYLEDFHVFSRNKTEKGNSFYGTKEGGDIFSEKYARGSGAVLVFENIDSQEQLQNYEPFAVSIHTMGNNLLKSNYGCFFGLNILDAIAMKAYQISAPIHIHMLTDTHVRTTKTTLDFDDCWPTSVDANGVVATTKHTNGYLGLKKQSNNAPSIDMGNPHTVVNFRGGRVELQNAQIVSENYKTTLAISHRSGYYGGDETGFHLSYGIGTDSVGGTVNFYDGTVTVEPMWVKEGYKQYYLLDTLDSGEEVKRNVGTEEKPIYEYQTSCLRTPKNTYVQGGSLCRIRACQHVTSKGGAPRDKASGSFLGQYVYTAEDGYTLSPVTNLVTQINFPGNVPNLETYHDSRGYTYGLHSITPDANGNLYFWIPDGYGGVEAEVDKFMSTWKACMTEIRAGLSGVVEGGVGGDTPIEPNEEVKYFLYCQIDKNIHDVIAAKDKTNPDAYVYQAPVKVPEVASQYFDGAEYTTISPSLVSDSVQYQVLSDTTYTITDRVYYVTTATADIWKTFTAPFDVAKVYVVETFSEKALEAIQIEEGENKRDKVLKEQARHNADFAAFFAVAMALGSTDTFEEIYQSYLDWAKDQDQKAGLYTDGRTYTLRSMQELTPYFGNNWRDANFYLNVNRGDWALTEDEYGYPAFAVKWEMLNQSDTTDGILLHKDSTYSMMFPYCTGCDESLDERTSWDYWSGKFLIFESTKAPQTIKGRDFLNEAVNGNIFTQEPDENEVVVTGNSTFAYLETNRDNVYKYYSDNYLNGEYFSPIEELEDQVIYPTTAFLYGEVPNNISNMPAKKVTREGKIIYGNGNGGNGDGGVTTGGHTPTVGGGNDLFITSINGGINVAVAAPQQVRVISSTGAVLFNGYISTAADVILPTKGVYVICGENEVQKIFF